jgi:hypothetical protein
MRFSCFRFLPACLVLACGGSVTGAPDGGAADSVPIQDAAAHPDARTIDADNPDAAIDAPVPLLPTDACITQGRFTYCMSCCMRSHGTGGFELLFYSECQGCAACAGSPPCELRSSIEPSAACIECLEKPLRASSSWSMCMQNEGCAAYVGCIEGCAQSF